jgi:hypothetical protein
MAIPERQLETWASQGAIATSSSTYQTIRNALLAPGTPYAGKDLDVFLQGSYGNDTNVYAESDVDVVIRLDDTFYTDLSDLPGDDRALYDASRIAATYSYDTFKADVVKALQNAFSDGFVHEGPKAVWIKPSGNRRSADVIVSAEYRRYHRFRSWQDQRYDSGICFWSGYTQIVNYPKQHSTNCTAKHQATNRWFKPTVRLLKNMRNRMVSAGLIEKKIAPSYYLEGLMYNVPNDKFGTSYEDTFVSAYNWIIKADSTEFVCANEQYYLLRDGNEVTWPVASGHAFLKQVAQYWEGWQ